VLLFGQLMAGIGAGTGTQHLFTFLVVASPLLPRGLGLPPGKLTVFSSCYLQLCWSLQVVRGAHEHLEGGGRGELQAPAATCWTRCCGFLRGWSLRLKRPCVSAPCCSRVVICSKCTRRVCLSNTELNDRVWISGALGTVCACRLLCALT
jgi:hypothetical protein